jgi:hypothetical protein
MGIQASDIAILKVASLQNEDGPEEIFRDSLADLYGSNSPHPPKTSTQSLQSRRQSLDFQLSIFNSPAFKTKES